MVVRREQIPVTFSHIRKNNPKSGKGLTRKTRKSFNQKSILWPWGWQITQQLPRRPQWRPRTLSGGQRQRCPLRVDGGLQGAAKESKELRAGRRSEHLGPESGVVQLWFQMILEVHGDLGDFLTWLRDKWGTFDGPLGHGMILESSTSELSPVLGGYFKPRVDSTTRNWVGSPHWISGWCFLLLIMHFLEHELLSIVLCFFPMFWKSDQNFTDFFPVSLIGSSPVKKDA